MDSSVRYCGCKWEECEQFASQLQLYASKDDCWNKDLVRERFYGKNLLMTVHKKVPLMNGASW